MPALVWDKIGERTFEKGVSKGVIYMTDGRSIPWNGLFSVTEGSDRAVTSVHYDGFKVNDLVSSGDFSGTISAYTYPDEMLELEGFARLGSGIYLAEQQPESFDMSYQTLVGNDLVGLGAGYKIHILYNVTAIPSERSYETSSADASFSPFEWEITTVPEEVPGFKPTSRIILDSREIQPGILSELERLLYGRDTADPAFPDFSTLMGMIVNQYAVDITDLKDGRWTASTKYDGYISRPGPDEFQIDNVDAQYIDVDTYEVSDTIA